MSPPKARSRWFSLASLLLAAAGVALAVLTIFSPPDSPDCENPDSPCSVFGAGERRMRSYELERIGGKNMVLLVDFQHWVATWFRGRKLEGLLAMGAFLSAFACWKVSGLLRLEEQQAAQAAEDRPSSADQRPGNPG